VAKFKNSGANDGVNMRNSGMGGGVKYGTMKIV
jgi:hypothetical protein